jgi:cellulose synthase/poly-beta-1,6-N-acetylglucosamine synthase-like glycosyltransferase
VSEVAVPTRQPDAAPAGAKTTQQPFISVFLTVRNQQNEVAKTITNLMGQDYDRNRFEVIVAVGQSSDDDNRHIAASFAAVFPNLTLIDIPTRFASAGRKAALRTARGDIILMVNGDCQIESPKYLADVVDAFQRSQADCIGRPLPLDVQGANSFQRAIGIARASRLGFPSGASLDPGRERFVNPQNAAVAYHRSVFETIGLYDEGFESEEDLEFNHRVAQAGLRCYLTPATGARRRQPRTLGLLFRQSAAQGNALLRLIRKHPQAFSAAILGPPLVVAWTAASLLIFVFGSGSLAWAGFTGIAVYLLAILMGSVWAAVRERSLNLSFLLPAIYLTIHAGQGLGLWWATLGALHAPRARPFASFLPHQKMNRGAHAP